MKLPGSTSADDSRSEDGSTFKDGSKRAMLVTMERLLTKEKWDNIWSNDILPLVGTTIEAMHPSLLWSAAMQDDVEEEEKLVSGGCFQIFGFDVLLDDYLQAHLLEVNSNPSMASDSIHLVSDGMDLPAMMSLSKEEKKDGTSKVKVCTCMDSHAPHYHHISAVDMWIKGTVLRGALDLVVQKDRGPVVILPYGYDKVPCREDGGLLSLVGETYMVLVGARRKMDGYKWRKFVTTVLQNENERSTNEEIREEIRVAENLWHRFKLCANDEGCGGHFDSLAFTKLLFTWITGRLQRCRKMNKEQDRKDTEEEDKNLMSLALSIHIQEGCQHFMSSVCERESSKRRL